MTMNLLGREDHFWVAAILAKPSHSLTKLAVQVSTCEIVPAVFVLLLKKICLIFAITENRKKILRAKISQYMVHYVHIHRQI